MSTPMRLLLAALPLATLGSVQYFLWSDPHLECKLTVYDAVVTPGDKPTLRAKLEHHGVAGINPDMRGYRLNFSGPPDWKAEATTGKDGVAEVVIDLPNKAGRCIAFDAEFPGSKRHKPARGGGRIFVWDKDSPILVTDIDHTISDLSQARLPFTDIKDIPPLPGAVAALNALAKDYRIVYLTAREDAMLTKTRDWLQLKEFPEGPVFVRDNLFSTTQEGFKSGFLKEFRRRYPKLLVGVAENPHDARAYLDNGLTPYMIDPNGKKKFPPGSVVVKSWDDIAKLLAK